MKLRNLLVIVLIHFCCCTTKESAASYQPAVDSVYIQKKTVSRSSRKNKRKEIDLLVSDTANLDSLFIPELNKYKQKMNLVVENDNFWLKIFRHPQSKQVYAVIYDALNEDKERLGFYRRENREWKSLGTSMNIPRFYPESSFLADFNFDGYADIALHVTSSNGCSSEYIRLYLFDPDHHSFNYCQAFTNSIKGSPIPLNNYKIIRSRVASCGCGCYSIYEHQWIGNQLRLVRELTKGFTSDTLQMVNYSPTGQVEKKSYRLVTKDESDYVYNYREYRKKNVNSSRR